MARFGGAVGIGPSLIYEQQLREAAAKGINPFAGYQPGSPDPGFAGTGGAPGLRAVGPGVQTVQTGGNDFMARLPPGANVGLGQAKGPGGAPGTTLSPIVDAGGGMTAGTLGGGQAPSYGDDMIATRVDPLAGNLRSVSAVLGTPEKGGPLAGAPYQPGNPDPGFARTATPAKGGPLAAPGYRSGNPDPGFAGGGAPAPTVADASGIVNLGGKNYRKGPGGWTEVQAPAPATPMPAAAPAAAAPAPEAPRIAAVPRSRDVYGRRLSTVDPNAVAGVLGGIAGGNMGRSGPFIPPATPPPPGRDAIPGGNMGRTGPFVPSTEAPQRKTTPDLGGAAGGNMPPGGAAPAPAGSSRVAPTPAAAGGDTVELGGKRYRKVGGRWQPA